MGLKYNGRPVNPRRYEPISDRDAYVARALSDFVQRVMEKPLTEPRLQAFLGKWERSEDPSIRTSIEARVRALTLLSEQKYPRGE